jgi:hypothetical protein
MANDSKQSLRKLALSKRTWRDTFLQHNLEVFMHAHHAFFFWKGDDHVRNKVELPARCLGCLSVGDLSYAQVESSPIRMNVDSSDFANLKMTTFISFKASFALPVCSACYELGFHERVSICQERELMDNEYVRFRFPNIGFYKPFAELNNRPQDYWISSKRAVPKQTQSDVDLHDKLLAEWEVVARGVGLHRFLELRAQLMTLEKEFWPAWWKRASKQAAIKARVDAILSDHALTLADLKRAVGCMGSSFGVLGGVGP